MKCSLFGRRAQNLQRDAGRGTMSCKYNEIGDEQAAYGRLFSGQVD
jgi:hypothetical protein